MVAVVGLKGGIGKSTLSQVFGCVLKASGQRVVILDADSDADDEQTSTSHWAALAAKHESDIPAVTRVNDPERVRDDIRRLVGLCDVLVVDCPPKASRPTRSALGVADLAILPVLTSGPQEIFSSKKTFAAIQRVQEDREEYGQRPLHAGLVFNGVEDCSSNDWCQAQVRATGMPVLGTIPRSKLVGKAAFFGKSVTDYRPKAPVSHALRAVVGAAMGMLNEEGEGVAHG